MTTVFSSVEGMDLGSSGNEVADFLDSVPVATSTNKPFASFTVLPGDEITAQIRSFMLSNRKAMDIAIGRGLTRASSSSTGSLMVFATIGGEIKYRHPNSFWVEPTSSQCGCGGGDSSTRYFPSLHDQVVGIVEDKGVDHYRVNINSLGPVFCSRLGFEGATKRNKPELRKGSVIYGKLTNVDFKNSEMEMTCKVIGGGSIQKDWSTGESIYGELSGGHIIHCSVACARYLLTPDCLALHLLAKHIAFEIVIGLNGIVWIHTGAAKDSSVLNTILVRNVILNTEYLLLSSGDANSDNAIPLNAQLEAMIQKLVASGKSLL